MKTSCLRAAVVALAVSHEDALCYDASGWHVISSTLTTIS